MDDNEKTALKAACLKAAATLLANQAAQRSGRYDEPAPDTAACVEFARDLFGKLTGEPWEERQPIQASRRPGFHRE
jgi:hypothetical protein